MNRTAMHGSFLCGLLILNCKTFADATPFDNETASINLLLSPRGFGAWALSAQPKAAHSAFQVDANRALLHWQQLLAVSGALSSALDGAISLHSLGHSMQELWDIFGSVEKLVLSEFMSFLVQAKSSRKHLTDRLESCELGKLLVNAVVHVASHFLERFAKDTLADALHSGLEAILRKISDMAHLVYLGYTSVRYLSFLIVRFVADHFLEGLLAWILQAVGGILEKWVLQKVLPELGALTIIFKEPFNSILNAVNSLWARPASNYIVSAARPFVNDILHAAGIQCLTHLRKEPSKMGWCGCKTGYVDFWQI